MPAVFIEGNIIEEALELLLKYDNDLGEELQIFRFLLEPKKIEKVDILESKLCDALEKVTALELENCEASEKIHSLELRKPINQKVVFLSMNTSAQEIDPIQQKVNPAFFRISVNVNERSVTLVRGGLYQIHVLSNQIYTENLQLLVNGKVIGQYIQSGRNPPKKGRKNTAQITKFAVLEAMSVLKVRFATSDSHACLSVLLLQQNEEDEGGEEEGPKKKKSKEYHVDDNDGHEGDEEEAEEEAEEEDEEEDEEYEEEEN